MAKTFPPLLERQLARARRGREDGSVDMDRLLDMVASAYEDMDSERRLSERALNLMEKELRAVNERLREEAEALVKTILSNVGDGVVIADEQGIIESVNAAIETTFRVPADDMIGRNLASLMPSPRAGDPDKYISDSLNTGIPHVLNTTIQTEAIRSGGEVFPIELSVGELLRADGRRFVGIIRDITTRKAAEAEILRARDEAEAASRAKSEFLSAMSHELRTPLNAVIGFAQLLEFNPGSPLDDEQKMCVDHIMGGGKHLLDLIDQVLDLARIESGQLNILVEDVAVDDIAVQCLQLIAPQALARSITVANWSDAHATVRADAVRFKQVLLNLLSNAVKYNREGGTLTLASDRSEPGWIWIGVTDTGEGIPESLHSGLFEPFNRLGKESSDILGAGVGLTVTKQLVEAMGGRIGFDSEVGRGSTFWVELPEV
ncbi:MAG: PAS domain S-box protein [Alphaproteobacteria bacterium]|nr:PAS domain S-box protein [Alphaproteobacteria bacterium]